MGANFNVNRDRRWHAVMPKCIGMLVLQCLCALCSPGYGQTTQSTAQELLQAATQASNWGERYASITDVKYRATVGEGPHQYVVGTDAVVNKYRDGDRLHIIIQFRGHLTRSGAYVARPGRRETVFAQDNRTYWWYPSDNPLTGTAQVARSPQRVSSMRHIEETDSSTGCFLDGDVDGLGSIIDIARTGDVSPDIRHEQILGADCAIIESRLQTGHASLWIAPSKASNILKYVLEMGDVSSGLVHAQFEAASLQTIQNRIVIAAGRSNRTWTDRDTHAKWQETVDAQRTKLDLHPTFADPNLFTTRTVPNGIRVFLDDMPNAGVDFVWYDGQPVAKVDPDLFSELDTSVQKTIVGTVSQTTPIIATPESEAMNQLAAHRINQMWLILCCSVGIALIALIGLYSRRCRAHGH
jgi:hypothetical protein